MASEQRVEVGSKVKYLRGPRRIDHSQTGVVLAIYLDSTSTFHVEWENGERDFYEGNQLELVEG